MLRKIAKTPQTSRWISGSILIAIGALAPACSSDPWAFDGEAPAPANINVVYDPGVDFSQYDTFALRDDADESADPLGGLDPVTRRDVELVGALVASELRDIGLIEVSAAEADVLAFSVARTSSAAGVRWSCVGGAWGGYWSWDYYYDPCAWLDAESFVVDRTTWVVGLLDPERSEVAFAGFARGVGDRPGSRWREISGAISRIFDRYPARPAPRDGSDAGALDADAGAARANGGAADAGL